MVSLMKIRSYQYLHRWNRMVVYSLWSASISRSVRKISSKSLDMLPIFLAGPVDFNIFPVFLNLITSTHCNRKIIQLDTKRVYTRRKPNLLVFVTTLIQL